MTVMSAEEIVDSLRRMAEIARAVADKFPEDETAETVATALEMALDAIGAND